jgi:hypothetical protein
VIYGASDPMGELRDKLEKVACPNAPLLMPSKGDIGTENPAGFTHLRNLGCNIFLRKEAIVEHERAPVSGAKNAGSHACQSRPQFDEPAGIELVEELLSPNLGNRERAHRIASTGLWLAQNVAEPGSFFGGIQGKLPRFEVEALKSEPPRILSEENVVRFGKCVDWMK